MKPHKLWIIHGAVARRSTKRWTSELKDYFNSHDLDAEIFFWSGLPFRASVRNASRNFLKEYNRDAATKNMLIFAKSMGTEIVNIAAEGMSEFPQKSLFLCPALKTSKSYHPAISRTATEVRLDRDLFLERWERLKMVSQPPRNTNAVIVEHSHNIGHHEISHLEHAMVAGKGNTNLKSLYFDLLTNSPND